MEKLRLQTVPLKGPLEEIKEQDTHSLRVSVAILTCPCGV